MRGVANRIQYEGVEMTNKIRRVKTHTPRQLVQGERLAHDETRLAADVAAAAAHL